MSQVGWDSVSNRWIGDWDNVVQAIGKLLTTRYFERVLREHVGSPVPSLLGETANVSSVLKFRWAIALAILLFEPRFVPVEISMQTLDRSGASGWTIRGYYRPRAHLGDLTIAGTVTLNLRAEGTGLIVTG